MSSYKSEKRVSSVSFHIPTEAKGRTWGFHNHGIKHILLYKSQPRTGSVEHIITQLTPLKQAAAYMAIVNNMMTYH